MMVVLMAGEVKMVVVIACGDLKGMGIKMIISVSVELRCLYD